MKHTLSKVLYWLLFIVFPPKSIAILPAKKEEETVEKENSPCVVPIQSSSAPALSNLQQIFLDAMRQRDNNRYDARLDPEFPIYVKKAFNYMLEAVDGIRPHNLIGAMDVGISDRNWSSFRQVFIELCKEIDIKAQISQRSYISFDSASVEKAVNTMKPYLDETSTLMLTQGPYR